MSADRDSRSRAGRLDELDGGEYDLLILGGGIHGAALAREAALRGRTVALIDRFDYSSGASSRSSKMLHGGVRYLEQREFGLVRESLRERAVLTHSAPHLARSEEFLYPIIRGLTRPAWQVGFGLSLYDLLSGVFSSSRGEFHKKRALDESDIRVGILNSFGLQTERAFSYFDGQMDDSRIVIEMILDAEKLGATSLNYVTPSAISRGSQTRSFEVFWECNVSKRRGSTRARYLVNATGGSLRDVHELFERWPESWPELRFSRGTHLLFRHPWPLPSLILPTQTRGRHYFVWPLFQYPEDVTIVGPTDYEITDYEFDGKPSKEEVDELLSFIERDLPQSGLSSDKLFQSFSGVRILPMKRGSKGTSELSRELSFLRRDRYLALLGGKFTSARSAAFRALKIIGKEMGWDVGEDISRIRPLPGGAGLTRQSIPTLIQRLSDELKTHGVPALLANNSAQLAVSRFGVRALEILQRLQSGDFDRQGGVDGVVLAAELDLTISEEHVITSADVIQRRLSLGYSPELGRSLTEDELISRVEARIGPQAGG